MKKRVIFAFILFLLLTTITFQQKFSISKFNLKEIKLENNSLIEEKDLKKLLAEFYNKNLLFLKTKEVEEALIKNSLIESFVIKKIYPNTLKIEIFEKKPIAILLNKKKKFYLSEKIELIDFKIQINYQNFPYVIGDHKKFKILYNDLNKINFPFSIVKKYTYYELNRWDIETLDNKIIKLPVENYISSIENFLDIRKDKNFKKYKIFDYRIGSQLILK